VLISGPGEGSRPECRAVGGELGDEAVFSALGLKGAAAKVDRAGEEACDIEVTGRIGGHVTSNLIIEVPEA